MGIDEHQKVVTALAGGRRNHHATISPPGPVSVDVKRLVIQKIALIQGLDKILPLWITQTQTGQHLQHVVLLGLAVGVGDITDMDHQIGQLMQHLREHGGDIEPMNRVVIGGSACPAALMDAFRHYGVRVRHAWGMTEMSPLGIVNTPRPEFAAWPEAKRRAMDAKTGHGFFGVEMKIVDDDDRELPWDGESVGALKVRGPWVCRAYYRGEGADAHDGAGWFNTGDVASIDEHGFAQITDRNKDMIKSGGEWIGSIELENIAVGCEGVAEAAAIAVAHPKWGERPLLVVRRVTGSTVDEATILAGYEDKVPRWWIPDAVAFVEEIPHTATGKISKLTLREQFAGYRFAGVDDA